MEDEIHNVKTVTVSHRRGGCCIHQTVTTILLVQGDERLEGLVAAALSQIDEIDQIGCAAQVTAAIEAVVAQVKQVVDVAMSREKNRVEKLEKEVAELTRELERCRQDRWGRMLVSMFAGVLLSDGLRSRLRGVRELLNLILSGE